MLAAPLALLNKIVLANTSAPSVVATATGLIVLLANSAPDGGVPTAVITIVGATLASGGVVGYAVRQVMGDWSRKQEASRVAAAEERAQDRADHQAWIVRFENIQQWERDQRERERTYLLSQVEVWRNRCDAVEERHNQFVVQYIEKQVNVRPEQASG